jgi:hypothetical protein
VTMPLSEIGLDFRLALRDYARLQSPKFFFQNEPSLSGSEKAGPVLRLIFSLLHFLLGHFMAFTAREHFLTPGMTPRPVAPSTDRSAVATWSSRSGAARREQVRTRNANKIRNL